MNKFALLTSIAAAAVMASVGMASAADLGPQPEVSYAPAPVYTPGNWYFRGDAGVGFADGSGGEAFTAGLGVGYRFSELFRSDLTVDWTGDYGSADAWALMANGYVDFAFGSWLKPYIGAGIGWGDVDQSGGSDDGLALAGHAGLTFDLAPQTELDLSYRYRTISVSGPDFDDHAFRAGLRYNF
jgi:opacity protein-like surface antigen